MKRSIVKLLMAVVLVVAALTVQQQPVAAVTSCNDAWFDCYLNYGCLVATAGDSTLCIDGQISVNVRCVSCLPGMEWFVIRSGGYCGTGGGC